MSIVPHLDQLDSGRYQPGVCNIGPDEIARRRLSGHLALIVSVGLLAVLVAAGAPAWTRLVIVLTVGAAASGYLQAWFHFCAGFGSRGVYNFGPVGTVNEVDDPEARSRDRWKSIEIGLASLAIGLAAGTVAALLPLR
jgi:hypothetical protein